MDSSGTSCVYRFQGFVLDVGSRRLSDPSGEVIRLGSRGFALLLELVRNRGELVSKAWLLEKVWSDVIVEENNLNQTISVLRKALGDTSFDSTFIQTVPGKGYCFVADVNREEAVTHFPNPANSGRNTKSPYLTLKHGGFGLAGLVFLALGFLINAKMTSSTEPLVPNQWQSASNISSSVQAQAIIPGSIIVLPFSHLNPDADSDIFVAGLHDELISQLAKVKSLKVISRDSVVSLLDSRNSIAEIASLLKVESLMEGTVLMQGNLARINLKMMNARTGLVLWTNSYEADTRNLPEMLSIQHEIAWSVAKALEIEIKPAESGRVASLPTKSAEAYKYYMAARNVYKHQEDREKWQLMEKVLELDPEFSDAHWVFASINSLFTASPMEGHTIDDHWQLMMKSVETFIRLEPERTEGYALKAVALGIKRDWEGVAAQIEILRDMNASVAELKYLAMLLMCFGDFQGAIRIYEESLVTEPVNLYSRGFLMAAYEMSGNQEKARAEYALGNELKSKWWGDSVNVVLALGRGEPLEGLDDLAGVSRELVLVLKNLDKPDVVHQAITNYMSTKTRFPAEAMYYIALAAYSGDNTAAVSLLRDSMEQVSTSIFWVWLPVFAELRSTDEFRQLLVDFGLVSYWKKHGWPEICQPYQDTFRCH